MINNERQREELECEDKTQGKPLPRGTTRVEISCHRNQLEIKGNQRKVKSLSCARRFSAPYSSVHYKDDPAAARAHVIPAGHTLDQTGNQLKSRGNLEISRNQLEITGFWYV